MSSDGRTVARSASITAVDHKHKTQQTSNNPRQKTKNEQTTNKEEPLSEEIG